MKGFFRSLAHRRLIPFIEPFEKRLKTILSPSDWAVVIVLGLIMMLSAGAIIASVSLSFTKTVPASGGTYVEGVVGTPRFINPLLAVSDADRDLTALVFSGLMKANPDGSLSPDIASSYTLSSDQLTYTFTISDKARFQDGTAVTADDVAFTVKEAQDPDVKSPARANWDGVTVNVIDEKTVSFTLKSPYAPFLANTTMGILPKHLWQNVTSEEFPFSTLNAQPVGSGPYRFGTLKENSSGIPVEYDLVAAKAGTRIPYIQTFILKFYDNADDLKTGLNQGEVNAAYSIDDKGLFAAHAVNQAVLGRVFGVFFDQSQNPVFADKAVRQALDLAVDKPAIVSSVLGGHGSTIDGPLPPTSVSASSGGASEKDRLAQAKALLQNDGWKPGPDGILAKTVTVGSKKQALKLQFSLATSNAPELKATAQMVAADWHALGAQVDLQFFDQSDLSVSVIRPRKYDALLFGLVVGSDLDLYAFWDSSQRNDPGLNIALYANADVDKKLEALRTVTDSVLRIQKAADVANEIASDTPAVFLYAPYFIYVTPPSLEGLTLGTISSPSDRFDDVDQWYLAKEQVWPIFTKRTQ